jgi:hypothetical protein
MADQSIQILIKTIADATGITLTTEQITKLKDAIGETKGETGALTDSTGELGGEMEKAGDKVEHLHLNHRALHQIMNLIGNETAPGLGRALAGALYGPIGIALALGYAFETVRKHIGETNNELDAFASLAADRGETIKQAMDKAFADVILSEAAAAIKKNFDDMATGMERYNTAAQQAAALAKELRQIELEKTNAVDAAANASDAEMVKKGTMSKEVAELRRLDRAAAEEKAKPAKEEADRAGELAVKKAEEGKMKQELLDLQQQQRNLPKPDLIGDANKAIAGMPKWAQKQFTDAAAIAPSGAGDMTTEIGRKATEVYLAGQNEVAKKMIGEEGKDGKPGTGLIGQRDNPNPKLDAAINQQQIVVDTGKEYSGDVVYIAEQESRLAQMKATRQAEIDAANKAIVNANDLILQNQLRIDSIKTILDAEKEYNAKIA